MPENCETCTQIVINLGIGKRVLPDYAFSGTYSSQNTAQQNQPAYTPSDTAVNMETGYNSGPNNFYAEQSVPEYDETVTMEEDDCDYPDRFALEEHEEHEEQATGEDDDYPDRYALDEEMPDTSTKEDDNYPDRFALEEHERFNTTEDDDYPDRFALSPADN